ncbi:hypothetical protein [Streptomyces ardesiacus]|uniref:hypothetical protein n=1 Tax=Streptomyces ardesiacus TaxID=285564 RepID=UPI002FDC412F
MSTTIPAPSTAPLPPEAAAALARALPHFPIVRAVAEYETAAVHAAQLAGLAESGRMSDLDARSLADAEDVMAAARTVLAEAGRLDLVDAMYAKAARFRALSTVIDRLTARDSHYMTPADWRELHGVQDERADLYFELKRAGRLDLVGGV